MNKQMKPLPSLTLPAKMFVLSLLVILPSCAPMMSSVVQTDKVASQSFGPIYWSKNDTDKTIAQIKEHNAAWKAVTKKKSDKLSLSFKERWFEGTPLQVTAFR